MSFPLRTSELVPESARGEFVAEPQWAYDDWMEKGPSLYSLPNNPEEVNGARLKVSQVVFETNRGTKYRINLYRGEMSGDHKHEMGIAVNQRIVRADVNIVETDDNGNIVAIDEEIISVFVDSDNNVAEYVEKDKIETD